MIMVLFGPDIESWKIMADINLWFIYDNPQFIHDWLKFMVLYYAKKFQQTADELCIALILYKKLFYMFQNNVNFWRKSISKHSLH